MSSQQQYSQDYQQMRSYPKALMALQRRPKRGRRPSNYQAGRDYICKCGRSYLSYPALYTHIKTKHEGKTSQFLKKRPARISRQPKPKEMPSFTPPNVYQNLIVDRNIPQEKQELDHLRIFLQRFYPQMGRHSQIKQIVRDMPDDETQYIQPLMQYWERQQRKQNKSLLAVDKSQGQYLCADLVFGKFLWEMNKKVNIHCLRFLCRLLIQIRDGLCYQKNNPAYCQQNSAKMIPCFFNDLIMNEHIPSKNYGLNNPKQKRWDMDPIIEDSSAVCQVMNFFSNWMYKNHFTDYSVKYRN